MKTKDELKTEIALTFVGLLIIAAIGLFADFSFASDTSKINFDTKKNVKKLKTLEADSERTIVLEGYIEPGITDSIVEQMEKLSETSNKPIFLMIDSPGGQVDAGFDVVNQIRALKEDKNLKVICGIRHQASSMAAIIASYCYETYATRRSTIMYHEVSAGIEGKVQDIQDSLAGLVRLNDEVAQDLAEQLGLTLEQYREKTSRRDWEMTATEAAEIGAINGVLDYLVYKKPEKPIDPLEMILRSMFPQ